MNSIHFKDHFSDQAEAYLKFRPLYPSSLYEYLASLVPSHQLAWDCATGNGQCANGLSPYFERIIASDASAQQIEHATSSSNIEYRVLTAEHTDITQHSVDLITVAQALHWFDIPDFFIEAQRVLKDQGIISVWTYSLFSVNYDINQVIHSLYYDLLAGYWPAERKAVENAYKEIDFPFKNIERRFFNMTTQWTLKELLAYLETWSAVQACRNSLKRDPLLNIRDNLLTIWGDETQKKEINWPLTSITGRYSL